MSDVSFFLIIIGMKFLELVTGKMELIKDPSNVMRRVLTN